ncbi:hypothetical protein YDYSY3_60560 [Paenibacillus chitinolyticus]|uniref:helix-turn-helix domain-containing protein n=1 Tax=Paenibacillus chitinolyticus TaxID=79263 RepID=UPI0026E4D3E8|nr:helix-turn-helix domain-containing protein [Paenibacillus chitinolyticus]GKS15056.1 hypothetical protein YDYSY3_60560 [Paenibacillus chitinolyticus]
MNTNELRNKRHDEQRIFFKVDVLAVRGGIIAKIGADGFATLATIASFMDEDGVCYPTQETLAEMMGVTRFTVIKRIRTLLETKLDDGTPVLERAWRNRTGGGVGKQSVYKVNMACGVSMGRDSKDVKSIDVKESHVSEIHVEEKHALMLKNGTNNVNNFNVSDVVAASHKEEPVFKKNQEEEPIKEERKDKLSYLSIPSENANDNNIHLPQVVEEDVEHKSFNWGEEWEKDFGDADRERRRKSERPLTAKEKADIEEIQNSRTVTYSLSDEMFEEAFGVKNNTSTSC